ncbi:hypothetical protein V3C99_000170 [Haemonchus contortus]
MTSLGPCDPKTAPLFMDSGAYIDGERQEVGRIGRPEDMQAEAHGEMCTDGWSRYRQRREWVDWEGDRYGQVQADMVTDGRWRREKKGHLDERSEAGEGGRRQRRRRGGGRGWIGEEGGG